MIHRGANYRKANGYIHTSLDSQYLHRSMPLIMVHRHDKIEVASLRPEEQCISRQRPLDREAAGLKRLNSRLNLLLLLPVAEQPVLAGMGVDATHANARVL